MSVVLRRSLLAATLAVVLGSAPSVRAAEEPRCNRWAIDVSCTTDVTRVILGDDFSATVTAKNTGDTALTNVTIRLRGDQGAPCLSGPAAGVNLVVERLEPGASKELQARFGPESIGIARVLGSARDSLGWAAGNCACTVEVVGLPAIHTSMVDKAISGKDDGVFRVGSEFEYVLDVVNDGGTTVTPDLKVVFVLPKELEFVGGGGEGAVKVEGKGQEAASSAFTLAAPDGRQRITLRVKALASPSTAGRLVKVVATVQSLDGTEVAAETESSTIH